MKLAAFPKCFMDELCVHHSMTVFDWIDIGAELGVDGLEFYTGFLESKQPDFLERVRASLERHGLAMPMLCYSPDFTRPDPRERELEVERQKRAIDLSAALGGITCRTLSGQRRPGVSRADGIRWVAECIEACLDHAAQRRITLVIENHYKDNYWTYPEFAQKSDVFLEILDQIQSPHFGVNFDPSNAILAGEDPLGLLDQVKHRVVTMHASDRYLKSGTLDDLRRMETSEGYASILAHGEIGQGLNDYDAIFRTLRSVGFDGWVSIEDGMEGVEQLRASVRFLRAKMKQ
jgi:sugar phosphate isomerase/epimerase